ncbi:alpha/beta hydrolase [Rothia koreensis]|uniref:alpha/beta fold hydrolase n=1 Tax=Rothia koreensis TaxID=592378 RepID=UPI003F224068
MPRSRRIPQTPAPSRPTTVFEKTPVGGLFPHESEFTSNGARVRYWTYTGPDSRDEDAVMLLVHGFRGDHHGLALIAEALASRWDVVVPDLPGFGKSEPLTTREHDVAAYADVVSDLVQLIGSRPVVLVGHSFGSVVAAAVAAQRPAPVAGLALINPICEPALESSARIPSLAAAAFYRVCAALPGRWGNALVRSSVVTRISSLLMMKTKDPELRRFINGQHDAYFGSFASRTVVLEAYRASIRDTVRDSAPRVAVPTLLVAAEKDDLGSVPGQESLAQTFPNARLEVIPDVGHLIHYETPRRAAAMIDGFADELELAQNGSSPTTRRPEAAR